MNQSFAPLLACPACKRDLQIEATVSSTQVIETGNLHCMNGHSYPIVRGIPRFVSSDGYASNFGFEWNLHNRTQLDTDTRHESEETFKEKTGFVPEDFKGKLVLDVGCGMGRFSDVASRWGATVVGIDLTSAVDAAYANIGGRENVHLAQADVFKLPFREETFDFIFSIGVLHHTPNTRAAFDQLPRLLKPGGRIAIWVYSSKMRGWSMTSDLYRHVTTRLPKRFLYALCHVAIPWYHVNRVPRVGPLTWRLLPTSIHPDPEWRVLDTFDWYSPTYQWKHSEPEVRGWFESQGLVSLTQLSFPTAMQGMRPQTSNLTNRAPAEVPISEVSR
jgi:2-polyprenyl-3-methyl-5-hydroxy-6-metoxy-1,4-benzoquinol methylase